jgi:hypothetical protein
MLKDIQLSTILLLVALGFLIYYLTKPKVSEGFAEEQEQEQPKQQAEPEGIAPEITQKILNEEEVRQVRTEAGVEGELPVDQVFDFQGMDVYDQGAELENAFEKPIPKQAQPDVVDINKNNVKKYDAKDFLPKEYNDQWFDTDFSQAKYNINDDKLINTERYVIGINTVGQSLKNASYDIRGTIANPKFSVSPWNNSTYEADFNLRPLC